MATARPMVTVAEARARAQKRVDQEGRDWAALGGDDAVLDIVLRPPTESVARSDQSAAVAWVGAWRAAEGVENALTIAWGLRQWPTVGTQSVPERAVLRGADAIASFAGAGYAREWRTLRERAAQLRRAFSTETAETDLITSGVLASTIRSHARTFQRLDEADFSILLDVVAWLDANPASGSRIRQLPIRGIDTKWLERHRSLVEALHAAVSGRRSLGLQESPNLVRIRFLDPALRPGGLCDVTAPVEELAALDVEPRTVFVFENLETMFAMPEIPGAVVVHGSGFAVGRLRAIPWIQAGNIVYWGDLDSHGFAILHALRSGCSGVTSVLMDEDTLLAHRDLWVPEPKPAVGLYPMITAGEQRALDRIRNEGNIRLEQERIAWAFALARLTAAAHH